MDSATDSYNAPEVFSHRDGVYFRGLISGTVGVVRTDCTPAGTCLLPVNPASFSTDGSNGWSLVLARNRLICDSSNTMYGHELHVADLCPSDFDNSGGDPQIDDFFGYLNAWFSYTDTADFDHGGTIDVSDVFLFLNAWFNGCA